MRRRAWLGTVAAVAFATHGAAFAQGYGPGIGAYGAPVGPTAQRGVVQGVVVGLGYGPGVLLIRSSIGPVLMRATPAQLTAMIPGQVGAFPYAMYLGTPWLTSPAVGEGATFGNQGTLTGVLAGVDKATGLIAVRGQLFRAHPAEVAYLVPGQFVSVTFNEVQNVPWVQAVQPVTAAGLGP